MINMPEEYWTGKHCLSKELPWLVPSAVHRLDELLTKDDYVFEVGTGGSTLFYAKRCGFIQAIETDQTWGGVVQNKLIGEDYLNHQYVTVPKDTVTIKTYVSINWSKGIPKITVLSVDTEQGLDRSNIFEFVLCECLHTLRVIVMDNYAEHSLWPKHWHMTEEQICARLGVGWVCETYDDCHWFGNGTRICMRKI